jgi:hypothetical protein
MPLIIGIFLLTDDMLKPVTYSFMVLVLSRKETYVFEYHIADMCRSLSR